MPPRSNAFQRLILLLESRLTLSGAVVTESLMLNDLIDGTPREIDIALEIPIGPRTIRVAVECRDHQRPASVQWINELTGKYLHLPVDRVVAVSRAGFTKAARIKAAAVKIELLTLDEAVSFDWKTLSQVGPSLCILTVWYEITSFELVPPPSDDLKLSSETIGNLMIYREPGRLITLSELVHAEICKMETRLFMLKTWRLLPKAPIHLTLLLTGWYYLDSLENEHALAQAEIFLKGGVDEIDLTVRPAMYANMKIAHGEAIVEGEPMGLVLFIRDGQEPEWRWYLKSTKEHPWRGMDTPPIIIGPTSDEIT